jgi:hypothetical protein
MRLVDSQYKGKAMKHKILINGKLSSQINLADREKGMTFAL